MVLHRTHCLYMSQKDNAACATGTKGCANCRFRPEPAGAEQRNMRSCKARQSMVCSPSTFHKRGSVAAGSCSVQRAEGHPYDSGVNSRHSACVRSCCQRTCRVCHVQDLDVARAVRGSLHDHVLPVPRAPHAERHRRIRLLVHERARPDALAGDAVPPQRAGSPRVIGLQTCSEVELGTCSSSAWTLPCTGRHDCWLNHDGVLTVTGEFCPSRAVSPQCRPLLHFPQCIWWAWLHTLGDGCGVNACMQGRTPVSQ